MVDAGPEPTFEEKIEVPHPPPSWADNTRKRVWQKKERCKYRVKATLPIMTLYMWSMILCKKG